MACKAENDTKPADPGDVDSLKKRVSLLDSVLGTQDEPAALGNTPAAPAKVGSAGATAVLILQACVVTPEVDLNSPNACPQRLNAKVEATSTPAAPGKVEVSSDLWERMRTADSARDASKKSDAPADEMSKILDSMKVCANAMHLDREVGITRIVVLR